MHPITAILVVKDNPPHIMETLQSIDGFVSEILIVDIGIDLKLRETLSQYKPVFIDIKTPVPYVELIREKVKGEAKQPYILFLDPDEIVPEALKKEWEQRLDKYDFIRTPRKNLIFGKWIRHSRWWPDYQIRLFRKEAVIWPTVIHAQPETKGEAYTINPLEELAILHHNYETIDEYFLKAIRYAKAESANLVALGNPPSLAVSMKKAVSEFISRFFADEGYKDGLHGFMLSFFQMVYPMLVYFYSQEQTGFKTPPSEKELIAESTGFFGKLFKESIYWKGKKDTTSIKNRIVEKLID